MIEDGAGDIVRSGMHLVTLSVPVEVFVEIERESGNWPRRIGDHIPKIA